MPKFFNLALKVDIDTYEGLKKGVPNLISILKKYNLGATFFITMGKDNSGKAIKRIFTKKGFLKKMFRTKAAKMYGLKTLFYGTLLSAPQIAKSNRDVLLKLKENNFEVAIHGYNHIKWQDNLNKMSSEEINQQLKLAIKIFKNIYGFKPKSFAAPGWICNYKSLIILEKLNFNYVSCTRGYKPYYPEINSKKFNILEIPTTLPTLDEMLGLPEYPPEKIAEILYQQLKKNTYNVFTLHSEVEGRNYKKLFENIIIYFLKQKVIFLTMQQIAEELKQKPEQIPVSKILLKEILGRAGKVAVQN